MHLKEVIFSSSDSTTSKKISKLEKNGEIRKIAPRIYTSNFSESSEKIIRRNIFSILQGNSMADMQQILEESNAFHEHNEGVLKIKAKN